MKSVNYNLFKPFTLITNKFEPVENLMTNSRINNKVIFCINNNYFSLLLNLHITIIGY